MDETRGLGVTRVCPVCGKRVYIAVPELWVYKRYRKRENVFLCSWSCFREDEHRYPGYAGLRKNPQKKQSV